VNDIDKLIELNGRGDARDRSAAWFFKRLLIVSLCICGLFILLVVVVAIFSHD
jgi:hypothetical protein